MRKWAILPNHGAHTAFGTVDAERRAWQCRRVKVLSRRQLFYDAGADPTRDRPAHVRAGSGCTMVDILGQGRRLAVVSDDANFIALVDTHSGNVAHVERPASPGCLRQFDEQRGNKADKLDLESIASVVVDGEPALLCMGSGSTARRETFMLVTLRSEGHVVEELEAPSFFDGVRQNHTFSGDELNVEAMVVEGDRAQFFNRGNGAGEGRDSVGKVSFQLLLKAWVPFELASVPEFCERDGLSAESLALIVAVCRP